MNTEGVIRLSLENFLPWLENKLNEKFGSCLESLKERFVGIFTIFKLMLEKIMELNEILASDTSDANVYNIFKPLIDNMARLLDVMMKEFPECLDLEFVELFFQSIQERIQIFLAHFHQILHIQHSNPNISSQINKIIRSIDKAILLVPQSVKDIQKRAELSVQLLKYIRDSKIMFKNPVKKLRDEIQTLSTNKSFEEYDQITEDVKNRSKGNTKFKFDILNKMIDLVKEACQYQFELNKMLKPYYSMANSVKTKGKKFFNDNLKSTDQAKLLKYVALLLRQDFISGALPTIEVSEMIYIIKLFESQGNLINEYKRNLIKGIEEFHLINPIEFEVVVEKYKMVMIEINNFQEFAQKNFEMIKFNKETISQILKDIKRVVDKYKEFQNGIYHYQEILEFFSKIRNLSATFCLNEFNVKVELICDYNLQ